MAKTASRSKLRQWWRDNRISCLVLAVCAALFIAARLFAAPERAAGHTAAEYAEYENAVITEVLTEHLHRPRLGQCRPGRAAAAGGGKDRSVQG